MPPQFELYTLVCISLSLHNSSVNSGLTIFRKAVSGKYRLFELAEEIRARRKVNLQLHNGTAQQLQESREDAGVCT